MEVIVFTDNAFSTDSLADVVHGAPQVGDPRGRHEDLGGGIGLNVLLPATDGEGHLEREAITEKV
jgi:hypothetical protein